MANAEHGGSGGAIGAGPDAKMAAVRVGLWLIAAALAVREITVVLTTPKGERLTDLETWIGPNGVLHVRGSFYDTDAFTGTPLAGLVLRPLTRSAEQALGVGWTFGTLLLVVALGMIAARALPPPVSRRTALLAAPVAVTLLMLSLPVRNTLHLGQTSIIPVLLVLAGTLAVRGERTGGILIGVAAALQPAVLLFAPLLWFTDRRRAAVTTAGTFVAATALAWAAMPRDSWTYWVHHFAGTGLGDRPDGVGNQSLHGALLRLGLEGTGEKLLFAALGAAVVWLGLRRAVRYARDGQLLLAVAVAGCVSAVVSTTAWQHQLLWVLLAMVGRVGKRRSDRLVWPVAVVLVMTLPAKMMLPNMGFLHPVRDNALLIAALAAACAVPFVLRTSPHFENPVPTEYGAPVPARYKWIPLLPFWKRALSRPNLLLELLLIRVGYSIYQQTRLVAAGSRANAEEHGSQIHAIEQALFIDVEHWANHATAKLPWLEEFLNFYYTSFHFVVPLSVLAVLYVRRPVDFRWARGALGFATVLALLGFWLYPLAPPRLMPDLGFIDTVHGVQDFSKPDYGTLTAVTNQYAAMPSLHFGWSLWCGVVIVILAPKTWMKLLGLLHPAFTLCAIVGTGNHWILDAVGGATVVGIGFGLVHVLAGPRPRIPVPRPAGEPAAERLTGGAGGPDPESPPGPERPGGEAVPPGEQSPEPVSSRSSAQAEPQG